MAPSSPLPPASNNGDPTLGLITQLHTGPSFREAATELLRQTLSELYPDLCIDPNTTLMGIPTWELVDDRIVAGPVHYQALSDILARQAVLAVPMQCIEGEHFLTRQPISDPATHLPVRIIEIAKALNTLAPAMLSACQEQLVAYWNESSGSGPRWHELSSSLRSLWNVQKAGAWDAIDCAMARGLFHAPVLSDRQPQDAYSSRAYLLDIQLADGDPLQPVSGAVIAVLIGQHQGKNRLLSYSMLDGYQKYDSLEQLGQSLPAHIGAAAQGKTLHWRLYEPPGHFFDEQACALLAMQIKAVGELDFSDLRQARPALDGPPDATQKVSNSGQSQEWYYHHLPDWLRQASSGDRNSYARHLKDLAVLNSLNNGQSYLDEIPPIREYALTTLKQQILLDHPDAIHLPFEQVVIQVQSLVTWGTFIVPGRLETTTFSLADLALQNLIAVPMGNKNVHLKNGQRLPAWMTVDYLEKLITQVDIGSAYPELIKNRLLDLRLESIRRKNLYASHLRIQLPLIALQNKIQQQCGIDERGYRYVAGVMHSEESERQVDGRTIVIRPLAFIPQRREGHAEDVVTNMYVIGPQPPGDGPCLLYRPLFDPPLIQYASPSNLLYGIAQSSDLRASVLAWLPNAVRADYANYVFPGALPSPWVVSDFLVEPDNLLIMNGPISLGGQPLNGDLFSTLFNANAQALIELADRQSVSNAENRWATLKQAGWMILNAILPFLGRTAGAALWIWQVVDELQQFVQAHEQGEEQLEWETLTDVLLNLGVALTLHLTTRRHGLESRPQTDKSTGPATVRQLPAPGPDTPVFLHKTPLYIQGAIQRQPGQLAQLLDSFKVSKPDGLGAVITEPGTYRYLYRHAERYYAPVGERWFEVQAREDEPVIIVDPKDPNRTSLPLIHNTKGQWFIDTRLRLLGGGPKRVIKKAVSDASIKSDELRSQLATFENAKAAAQQLLQQAHQEMTDAPSTSAAVKREHYLQALLGRQTSYEEALQRLKTLNVFSPSSDYQPKALAYIKAQLALNETGILEAQTTFTPKLHTVLDHIEHQARDREVRHISDARQMTTMSQDMIERLDYTQSRFDQLKTLALEGTRLIQESRGRLPSYTSDDLKALQVTLARNLCLTESSLSHRPEAWNAIDALVDTADISVQALRDTLLERSEARLDERIEALCSLIEQFKVIDERLGDFQQEFSDSAVPEEVKLLQQKIHGFSQQTLAQLALLSAERDNLRARPTPPPTPPRPKKRFIHSRYNGMLIGEPRMTKQGLETGLVDIRSPLTQQVIATFHEKDKDVWVQHITASEAELPVPVPDIRTGLEKGQALLDGLTTFFTRAAAQQENTERTAQGIEYLFHQHARLMEQADHALEKALEQGRPTDHQRRTGAIIRRQLKEAATTLYQHATQFMMQITKQRAPTINGVEWLKEHNAITIKQTLKRRRLKGPKPDYLDEYVITDRATGTVLWYAHFHYSASWASTKRFLFARLKTPQEYRQGPEADVLKNPTRQQQIDFYRSGINLEQARKLFFTS